MERKTLIEYKPKISDDERKVSFIEANGSNLPDTQAVLHKRMAIINRSTRMRQISNKPLLQPVEEIQSYETFWCMKKTQANV